MMPPGLANELSYEEFASLITFLSQQKKIASMPLLVFFTGRRALDMLDSQ